MAALDVGAKVRVLGGPFAGRVGVISELDGKGGARVTLGLLSARVLLENLRVTTKRSGKMERAASVSLPDIRSVTASELASPKAVFTVLSTAKPRSILTWVRSFVARLMISPEGILR